MIEVGPHIKPSAMTDWAELSCLSADQDSLSRPKVQQALEDANISNSEDIVSDIWQQISQRHRLIESAHPIKSITGRLERLMSWENTPAYTFQLLLASHSFYETTKLEGANWNDAAKLFEELSTLVIKHFLDGEAVNIGFPRGPGVPKGFRKCLDFICEKLREQRGEEKSYNLPTMKDKGVDIVAWRPFPDMRSNQIFILAQCAAGKDWKDKADEIKLKVWNRFIDWRTPPLKAFAFPYVCINEDDWKYLSDLSQSLLLDRLRITSIFVIDDQSEPLLQKIKQWCNTQIAKLPKLDI